MASCGVSIDEGGGRSRGTLFDVERVMGVNYQAIDRNMGLSDVIRHKRFVVEKVIPSLGFKHESTGCFESTGVTGFLRRNLDETIEKRGGSFQGISLILQIFGELCSENLLVKAVFSEMAYDPYNWGSDSEFSSSNFEHYYAECESDVGFLENHKTACEEMQLRIERFLNFPQEKLQYLDKDTYQDAYAELCTIHDSIGEVSKELTDASVSIDLRATGSDH